MVLGVAVVACGPAVVEPAGPTQQVPTDQGATQQASASTQKVGPVLMTVRGWRMAGDGTRGPFAIDDTLKSGDYFSYYVRVDRDAFVYVMQFYSGGRGQVLFPESGDRLISAGQEARVPIDAGSWFQLDEAIGTEHMYVIASVEPLARSAPEVAAMVGAVRASPEVGATPMLLSEYKKKHLVADDESRTHARGLDVQPAAKSKRYVAPGEASYKAPKKRGFTHAEAQQAMADVRTRAVNLVRVDGAGDVAYQGRTDKRGVGIAHFPFRHE
jgi:hypothetical protein